MDRPVIAISRSLGAGGEEIARAVAEALSYRYVDDEIINQAARAAGVSPEAVGAVEQTPSLLARILTSIGAASPEAPFYAPAEMPLPDYSARGYQELITNVIRATAAEGKVVIVAHGASIPLAGTEGLLRVLVTASPATRATRTAAAAKVSERDATRAVESSDNQRREFLRRFYNVHEELPTHYDLVLNTDVLSATEATRLIVAAAQPESS